MKGFWALLPALLLAIPLSSEPVSSQNLAEAGRQAEAAGNFNLAAHYYHHALKAGGDSGVQQAYDRVMQKRRDARVKAKNVAPGPRSETPLSKGHGVILGDEGREASKFLNDYNLAAPRAQRIKYVFAPAATLSLSGSEPTLSWNGDLALILGDTLAGEGRAYALVSGQGLQGLEGVSAEAWEAVAAQLVTKTAQEDRIHGILLDLGAANAGVLALSAAIKRQSPKPLGIAVASWDKSLFAYCDVAVLLARSEGDAVRDQAKAFLDDARSENGKALFALDSDVKAIEAGRAALGPALIDDDPAYLGICLKPYPVKDIPGPIWDLLKLPLERP